MEDCNKCQECTGCNESGSPVMPPQNAGARCVDPNPCSFAVPSGCVFNSRITNKLCGAEIVYLPTDNQEQINSKIVDFFCSKIQNVLYEEVTRAEALILIAGEDLVPGRLYKITDSGYYLIALTTTSFAPNGLREMRILNQNLYMPYATGQDKGVWIALTTAAIGDRAVHGGKLWQNLTGNIGTQIDFTALDNTNWQLIPTTNTTYYTTKTFEVSYDFTNDWTYFQKDERGNEVTSSLVIGTLLGELENRIEYSDWGHVLCWYNKCRGFINNGDVVFNNNLLFGDIINNKGGVTGNSNKGNIRDNSCAVDLNSNAGEIAGNVLPVGYSISRNRNNGRIINNTISGQISDNSNEGEISGLGISVTGVTNNVNNGTITTTVVGPISDPTVNK